MQNDLFVNDVPQYETPHRLLAGKAVVKSHVTNTEFTVDFDNGTCTCRDGEPFVWNSKKQIWKDNRWCTHKLRALASLLKNTENKNSKELLDRIYFSKLSKNYIVWEAVSVFHKELRRGDLNKAIYWAYIVAGHRGFKGVINYMLNIVFEETRDTYLYKTLLDTIEQGDIITVKQLTHCVCCFVKSKKKWELPHRLSIFINEMQGYKNLAEDFGYDVAKGKDIIPSKYVAHLKGELLEGFDKKDIVRLQYGLKGFYKAKSRDHEHHKLTLFNILTDVLNEEYPNKFSYNRLYCFKLHGLIHRRILKQNRVGYHELNAFADALTGEIDHSLPTLARKLSLKRPAVLKPPYGVFHKVPLYAQDNHTYVGKSLMKRFGSVELLPSAEQYNIDFRWCGAYMGVAWRYLAYDQYKTCDVPWGKVKWRYSWLWKHLDRMWY